MDTSDEHDTPSSATLHGWKDIASYLGRSVRAVQRWERELGLPVRRIRTAEGQTVYAERVEIDQWKKSRDLPTPDPEETEENEELETEPGIVTPAGTRPTWVAFWTAAVAALIVGAAATYVTGPALAGPISTLQVAGTSVSAFDGSGQLIWRHEMGMQVLPAVMDDGRPTGPIRIGNKTVYLALINYSTPIGWSKRNDAVLAFDGTGNILWTVQPDIQLTCGAETFGAPWHLSALTASSDTQHPRIWVAYRHHTWWPSMVFEIDETGKSTQRYLQNGWIRGLAEWPDSGGRLLALNGVSNEFEKASTTVIDLTAPVASAPHTDPRFDCAGQATGKPASVFLWPALDVQGPEAYAMATQFSQSVDGLQVQIEQGGGGAVVELDSPLHVKSLSLADRYWTVHRQREAEGWVKHTADVCPERGKPQQVEHWTPTTGWVHSTIVATVRQTVSKKQP